MRRTIGACTDDASLFRSNGLVDCDDCGKVCMGCEKQATFAISDGSCQCREASKQYKPKQKIPSEYYIAY